MNPESASTLIGLTVILIFLGFVSLNPAASFLLFVLASLSAAAPALLARKRVRLMGALAFLVSVTLAAISYPAYKKHMQAYSERIRSSSPKHYSTTKL